MKQSSLNKIVFRVKAIGLVLAYLHLGACTSNAGDQISKGIRCMEAPLAPYCDPIAVDDDNLEYEEIKRESDESLLKNHSFMKKYSGISFGISKNKESCSETEYDIDSVPKKGAFNRLPEGTYKVCVKYYLSANNFRYKSSEPIKVLAARKKIKITESWFVKEIRKHSKKRNSH